MGKKVVRVVMERGQFEFNSEKGLVSFSGGKRGSSSSVRVQELDHATGRKKGTKGGWEDMTILMKFMMKRMYSSKHLKIACHTIGGGSPRELRIYTYN